MPKITLENITKRWGDFVAVDQLNLEIEDGEFITFLGPSGCGKTTTLRMIAGLETPTVGRITIGDRVVFDSERGINISAAKRDVGFLFQNYALWPHMTVYQNIAFGLETLKWEKGAIKERVGEMLKTMQIEQFSHRYPAELSGGQQQRVAIARTLAPHPKVLFMDEPLSNLDAKLRSEMRTELKRLHKDTGSTFVYVTHDQLEAMALATRISLLDEGILQQYDPPLTVYEEPANLFVADFIGNPSMNFIEATATQNGKRQATIHMLGHTFSFTAIEEFALSSDQFTVGIRPEFLSIEEEGGLSGTVYSTLPAGMETTVKIVTKEVVLSSVMFGSLDYEIDSTVNFSVTGNKILLFDSESTNAIAMGSLALEE